MIEPIRKKMPRYGTEKLHLDIAEKLRQSNIKMGRDRFLTFCRQHRLLVPKTKRSFITTDSNHHYHKPPNRIKDLVVTHAEQVFVADITYIKLEDRHAYLALVTDLYSKKIMGYKLDDNMRTSLVKEALQMAINNKEHNCINTIHHSDRGVQYLAMSYTQRLAEAGQRVQLFEAQATVGFLGRWQYYIQELGITVIQPNVRGSTGFGKTFVTLDNGFKREDSVRDIGALLDWITTQPDMDADRVIVSGGSYGGYMSLAVATHYSDRIAGAIDIVGISHFVTFLNNTESYRRDLRRDLRAADVRAFHHDLGDRAGAAKGMGVRDRAAAGQRQAVVAGIDLPHRLHRPGFERHGDGEGLEGRTQLEHAVGRAIELRLRVHVARDIGIELREAGHRQHFAGVDIEQDAGRADRAELRLGLDQFMFQGLLDAAADRQRQRLPGLGRIGQLLVEGELHAGRAVPVDVGIAEHMGGKVGLGIKAVGLARQGDARLAKGVQRRYQARRGAAAQIDEALARVDLGQPSRGILLGHQPGKFAGQCGLVADDFRGL